MGSRIRRKSERLFEVFVEIAKPVGKDDEPFIIQQYPTDFIDEEALKMIPKFAYPCPLEVSQVEYFTFVLTDLDSLFRFGHCRHTTGHQTCFCIVSWLPWCEIFYRMLDLLTDITNRSEKNQVTSFLEAAYIQEVPLPKIPVTVVIDQDMFSFTAPDPNALPRIPGSRNLTEYYNAVDTYNMMLIFASMLHERRIYMTSKKLSRLTACIHAAEALLYPMHWQHLYIPVLPAHLIDYISAPMPYVIGVHSNLVEKLKQNRVDVGDAVVVDLDANTVTTEYDDLGDLPEDVSSYLKRNLKTDVVKSSVMKTGDAVSMAFLNALVRLIGGYRDALKFRPGEPITFDPESFVHSRPSQTTQSFLEGMLTLQIFQQFVYGRLEILNAGDGFADIFEQQASLFADKLNSQSKYKEWLKSVKKSGKKSWTGLKVKVKEQGKKAMADFKTKLSGLTDNDDRKWGGGPISGGVHHTKPTKSRPVTAHAGSLSRTQRAPAHGSATLSEYERRNKLSSRTQSIGDSQDDSQLRLSYHTVDVSLMSDSDIQAAMLRSASAEMLSEQTEITSSDSNGQSSDSENDGSAEIAFDPLHSSDEALNFTTSSQENTSHRQQQHKSAVIGDKLIQTRAPSAVIIQPVAAPRLKKAKLHSSSPQANPVSVLSTEPGVSKSLKQEQARLSMKGEITDAPLIKFDSPESEKALVDNFDPLFANISSANYTGSKESQKHMGEAGMALSHGSTGISSSVQQVANKDLTNDLFDPLSDLSGLSLSNKSLNSRSTSHSIRNDPLSSHSPRRDSSDLLLHEWSLASLARSHGSSLPKVAQPLKMSYPNNPFLLGNFQKQLPMNSSLHNQGNVKIPPGLNLGHKVSDFHKVNQLRFQQPFRASRSPSPTPGHLSAASYAPYSHTQTSSAPQVPAVVNVPASVSSTGTHMIRAPGPGSNTAGKTNSVPQQRTDFFSDLLDIDFGGQSSRSASPDAQKQLMTHRVPSPVPSQSQWETFD